MKKKLPLIALLFASLNVAAQNDNKKVIGYLLTQYTKTITDRTLGNNPWGAGLGLQAFFKTKSNFTITLEVTGDIYLEDDKVQRVNSDGTNMVPADDVPGMINIFAGACYNFKKNGFISLTGGPSFINGKALAGIKPSIGFYLSKKKKSIFKFSYIDVFNRDKKTMQDFTSVSFSIGFKLF